MSILKDTRSVPAIILKNVDFPQIAADILPVKLPELPILKKTEKLDTPAVIAAPKKKTVLNRVMECEYTPIVAAAAAGFLAGVVVGVLISPAKNGIQLFSNNDFHTEESAWCDDDEEDDED